MKTDKEKHSEDVPPAESLREAESRYRTLFEQAPDGILIIDLNGQIIEFNDTAHRQLGYTREEFAGLHIPDFEATETPEETEAHVEKILHEGRDDFETLHRTRQGEIRNVRVTVQTVELSGRKVLQSVFRDVTDSKRAEEALRRAHEELEMRVEERTLELAMTNDALRVEIEERKRAEATLRDSEERFRATFEQAAVGIAHVAPDGRWLRVNQRLCDIVGYTHEELMERTFQDIIHPDDLDADLALVRQVLADEIKTYSMEKRYIRKDGSHVWINLTVSLVREATGEPRYFISVVEDISDRKRAEEEIRRLN